MSQHYWDYFTKALNPRRIDPVHLPGYLSLNWLTVDLLHELQVLLEQPEIKWPAQ